jgi:hypothetical protein
MDTMTFTCAAAAAVSQMWPGRIGPLVNQQVQFSRSYAWLPGANKQGEYATHSYCEYMFLTRSESAIGGARVRAHTLGYGMYLNCCVRATIAACGRHVHQAY